MKQTSLRQLYCPANGDVGGTYEKKPDDTRRADLVMTEGFGLEVDGRMRTIFPTLGAAQKSALDIKTKYPMLQVKVYDAAKRPERWWGARLVQRLSPPDEKQAVSHEIHEGGLVPEK